MYLYICKKHYFSSEIEISKFLKVKNVIYIYFVTIKTILVYLFVQYSEVVKINFCSSKNSIVRYITT